MNPFDLATNDKSGNYNTIQYDAEYNVLEASFAQVRKKKS